MESSDFAEIPQLALVLTEDSCSLREAVAAWVKAELLPLVPKRARLVSIDGLDGVGKSTVADAVAHCSGATLIQLDAFLEQDRNRYLNALDLDAFKARIENTAKAVVEGCLVQAALARTSLSSDFSIYLVRTTQMQAQPDAEWVDERDMLFGSKGAEELIVEEEESMRRWGEYFSEPGDSPHSYELPGLRQELIRYHAEMSPHPRPT